MEGKEAATAAWESTAVQPTSTLLNHIPDCKGQTKQFHVHVKALSGKSTRKASGRRVVSMLFMMTLASVSASPQ